MTSGIYTITNTTNGRVYVGSSIKIESRWDGHRKGLRAKTHVNILLQRAWAKYGESCFEFKVVEEIDCDKPELMLAAEQRLIDSTQSWRRGYGYNICREANRPKSGLAYAWPPRGKQTPSQPKVVQLKKPVVQPKQRATQPKQRVIQPKRPRRREQALVDRFPITVVQAKVGSPGPYFSTRDIAGDICVAPQVVREIMEDHDIPRARLGNTYIVDVDALNYIRNLYSIQPLTAA